LRAGIFSLFVRRSTGTEPWVGSLSFRMKFQSEMTMKKILIATAALALMTGVASAQINQGTGSNNSGPSNTENSKEKSGSGVSGSPSNTTGSSGMSKQAPAKAQPGGLAGSGGPNAGNQGAAAPGGSAGGGNGGSGSK